MTSELKYKQKCTVSPKNSFINTAYALGQVGLDAAWICIYVYFINEVRSKIKLLWFPKAIWVI